MVLTTQYQVAVTSSVSPIKEPAPSVGVRLYGFVRRLPCASHQSEVFRRQPRAEKPEQVGIADRNSELRGVGRILNPRACTNRF